MGRYLVQSYLKTLDGWTAWLDDFGLPFREPTCLDYNQGGIDMEDQTESAGFILVLAWLRLTPRRYSPKRLARYYLDGKKMDRDAVAR